MPRHFSYELTTCRASLLRFSSGSARRMRNQNSAYSKILHLLFFYDVQYIYSVKHTLLKSLDTGFNYVYVAREYNLLSSDLNFLLDFSALFLAQRHTYMYIYICCTYSRSKIRAHMASPQSKLNYLLATYLSRPHARDRVRRTARPIPRISAS